MGAWQREAHARLRHERQSASTRFPSRGRRVTSRQRAVIRSRQTAGWHGRPQPTHRGLPGHQYREDGGGDGWTSPREQWGQCSCGFPLWHDMQGYGSDPDDVDWVAHLDEVRKARRQILRHKTKP